MSRPLELVNIITQALVTVVVGTAAVYVAFRQYRLDQRQVKLEQRRARVEIHERLQPTIQAVMTLLAKVIQDEIPQGGYSGIYPSYGESDPTSRR